MGIFDGFWTGTEWDTSSESYSPFSAACLFGHADVVDVLFTRLGAIMDVNQVGWNGETALHGAAARDHLQIVQTLLDRMSSEALVLETKQGKSALALAVDQGRREVMDAIISKCGLPNYTGVSDTLLSVAVLQNDPEFIELLLDYGELPQTPCGDFRECLPRPGDWEMNINKVLRYCRFLSRSGCVPATRITPETPERFRATGHTAVHHVADLIQDTLKWRIATVWCAMFRRQENVFKGLVGSDFGWRRVGALKDHEDVVEGIIYTVRNTKNEVSELRN
jgi:hypothetical protein